MSFRQIITFTKRHHLIFLLLFSLGLFYFRIWTTNIFFTDELIIEDASYVMGKGGDLIVPLLDGVPYFTKPPLIYWQTAPLYYLFPPIHFLVRFWMPIYGLGTVLITYLIGKLWYGKRVGFVSGLLLATCMPFVFYTKSANYDIPNAFFTVACIYFYNLAKKEHKFLWLSAVTFLLGLFARSWLALTPCAVILIDQLFIVKNRISWRYLTALFVVPILIFGVWNWIAYLKSPEAFIYETFSIPFKLHLAGQVPGDIKSNIPFPLLVFVCFPGVVFLFCYKYFYAIKINKSAFVQLCIWIGGLGGLLSLSQTQHDWYLIALLPALALASSVIIASIFENSNKDSMVRFAALVGFISVVITAPMSLLINGVPQSEIISQIYFVKDNNNGQPVYFWTYLLNPKTRFFPGRDVIIVDKTSFENYLTQGKLKFLLARTSDIPDIAALTKPIKTYPSGGMTILEFK